MAFIDAAPPSRWSFVYPWCHALRGRLDLEGQVADNSSRWEYRWVVVRLPHTPEEGGLASLGKIREALDLLARIAVQDNAAWRALLVQQCRVLREEDDLPLDCDLSPQFRFVFNEKFVGNGSLSPAVVCRRFFVDATTQRVSEEYLEARRVLEQLESSLDSRNPCTIRGADSVFFELQFELLALQNDILEKHLRDLSAMFDVLQATRGPTVSSGSLLPLQLESIRLDVGSFNASWSLTQRLIHLLGSRLPFSLFAFILKKGIADNDRQARENLGHFLHTVLCRQVIHEHGSGGVKRGGIQSLSVGCHGSDQWQFAALCSAIAAASATKNLRLYGVFQSSDSVELRNWKWRWLTYALFRTKTESSVTKVLISPAHLTHDCNSAITTVLSTNNPPIPAFRENYQEGVTVQNTNRSDKSGYFQEGTQFTLIGEEAGNHDENIASSILLEEDSWLHVVGGDDNPDSPYLDAVLPGFGVVRADRVSARQIEQCHSWRPIDEPFGLKALTLALPFHPGTDGSALENFLELVGDPLQFLAVYSMGLYLISMATICQACPQLKELFLDGIQLKNSDHFCVDAERMNSQIVRLGLANVFSTNDEITQLAETIGRSTLPFVEQLSELNVVGSDMSCAINETNVLAFLEMLKINKKLTFLRLGVRPELKEKYDDAFQRHHGEPLSVVKHKFAIACKAAFLSIVSSSTSAGSAFDEGVLFLIFSFAATCENRVVSIRYDD